MQRILILDAVHQDSTHNTNYNYIAHVLVFIREECHVLSAPKCLGKLLISRGLSLCQTYIPLLTNTQHGQRWAVMEHFEIALLIHFEIYFIKRRGNSIHPKIVHSVPLGCNSLAYRECMHSGTSVIMGL